MNISHAYSGISAYKEILLCFKIYIIDTKGLAQLGEVG